MNIALWSIAGLLAVVFLASGAQKLFQSKERLIASGFGVLDGFSPGVIKTIGGLEILAAIGLTLPAMLDIAPVLVPVAAVGVVLLMAGAMIAHGRRREVPAVIVTLFVLAMAAAVVWGRFGPEPFSA